MTDDVGIIEKLGEPLVIEDAEEDAENDDVFVDELDKEAHAVEDTERQDDRDEATVFDELEVKLSRELALAHFVCIGDSEELAE